MNQFRNMGVRGQIASPGHIEKLPGEALGATLTFEHKGSGCFVYMGIGLAYGKFIGHNPPFQIIWEHHLIDNHNEWTPLSEGVWGTLNSGVVPGKLLDCQKFISDTQPLPGQQPPNPFGTNDWDDEVYVVLSTGIDLTLKIDDQVVEGDYVMMCAGNRKITIGVANGTGYHYSFDVVGWGLIPVAQNVYVGSGEYKEFSSTWEFAPTDQPNAAKLCVKPAGESLVCPRTVTYEVQVC